MYICMYIQYLQCSLFSWQTSCISPSVCAFQTSAVFLVKWSHLFSPSSLSLHLHPPIFIPSSLSLQGIDVGAALRDFYRKHYSAQFMSLAVVSCGKPESTQCVQMKSNSSTHIQYTEQCILFYTLYGYTVGIQ